MQFTRVLVGWLAVSLLFLAVQRLVPPSRGLPSRAPRWLPFAEALPFTLLAALWFASLGRGGWPLVLALVALVVELPALLRDGWPPERRRWREALLGAARLVVAALLLRWIL
ncbi:MAG: hypothetical protein MUC69_01945 [Gemmatimonadales bacterium]|nr:hypothetical protein [Gemmatimonadales bacterium]